MGAVAELDVGLLADVFDAAALIPPPAPAPVPVDAAVDAAAAALVLSLPIARAAGVNGRAAENREGCLSARLAYNWLVSVIFLFVSTSFSRDCLSAFTWITCALASLPLVSSSSLSLSCSSIPSAIDVRRPWTYNEFITDIE